MAVNKELATENLERLERRRELEDYRLNRFRNDSPFVYSVLYGPRLLITRVLFEFHRLRQWWRKRGRPEPAYPLHGNVSSDKPGLHCSKCGVFRWWDHGLPEGTMLPPCLICGNTQVAEDEPVSSACKGAVYVGLGYARQVDGREQIYVGKCKLVDPYAAPRSSTDSEGKLRKTVEFDGKFIREE